jgi:hypothetical protein
MAVDQATSPVTIRARRPATLVRAIAEKFGWILNEFSDQERGGKIHQTSSKGNIGPMALPLLGEPDHQRVVAGIRRFTVAWTGGTPPFIASLTSMAGTLTLAPMASADQRASALLELGVGRYEVRVTDAKGVTRWAHVDVVANQPFIDEAGFADAPDDVRLAMASIQLARTDGGRWRLEAFQRLTEAAQK